jgi:hypothetical protein
VARRAGLSTRTGTGDPCWRLVNCIAIQELESWYFGDWQAVRAAFSRVQYSINRKEKFRDPDAITGTWEAFECVLKRHGYFQTGLRKIEAARVLGALVERERTQSRSFTHFCDAILEAAT